MSWTDDPIPLKLIRLQDDPSTSEIQSAIFDLDPIGEVCLRFLLHIDSAPPGISVEMNRWHLGITQTGTPFIADVTDYVTLEDNVLLLTVNQPGQFGVVW